MLFWHLLFHVPDIWIILTQLLDVLLYFVFFLLPNDIGNVVYGGNEPVSIRALQTERHRGPSQGAVLPLGGQCAAGGQQGAG